MKKLSIQLNQNYRSFNKEFNCCLEGDLIILSGVNGSGKSQLMNIISQEDGRIPRKTIDALVKIDDLRITRKDVLCRSFKHNINVPELTHAGTISIDNHKNAAQGAYNNYLLDSNNENLWDHKDSADRAKKILIQKFGEAKFNSRNQISNNEFRSALPSDFVWKSDDIFTNFIGDLFFSYALDVYDAKAEAGESGVRFDPALLKRPPWEQLNSLFSELKLDYRFKENYFVNKGFQINEQPSLYQIQNNGIIDEKDSRSLADLSDGEKAIIALSFASLSGVKHEERKLLLLDEFDANLNPSLTQVFYKILNKYFIEQGILVVITTHSPTTISLAPDNASFYEVFKQNKSFVERILPVHKDDYLELQNANNRFYEKISNQASRIIELEVERNESAKLISQLSNQTKPLLFVEGDIDIQYIRMAAKFFPEWQDILNEFDIDEKNGKDNLGKYWGQRAQINEFLKSSLILLFDCDTNRKNQDDKPFYSRCIPMEDKNSIKKGIENLFPDDLILKAETSESKKYTQKSLPDLDKGNQQIWKIIDSEKKNLANWICANAAKNDFVNFGVIFDMLKIIWESK